MTWGAEQKTARDNIRVKARKTTRQSLKRENIKESIRDEIRDNIRVKARNTTKQSLKKGKY